MEAEQQDSSLHFLDYWRVVVARKEIVLIIILIVMVLGFAVSYFVLPQKFEAQCRIEVKRDSTDVDIFAQQMMGGYDPYFLRTESVTITALPQLNEVIDNLGLRKEWGREENGDVQELTREETVMLLRSMISIDQVRDTSQISIGVRSTDSNEAANIANGIADVYKKYRLDSALEPRKQGIATLKEEEIAQRRSVAEAEKKVEDIRKEGGVSTFSQGFTLDMERVRRLEFDRTQARIEMLVRKARLDEMADLDGDELLNAIVFVVPDQNIAALRQQLSQAKVNLQLLMQTYAENHPQVKQTRAGRDELQMQLDAALRGVKKGLQVDYTVAKEKYQAVQDELDQAAAEEISGVREKMRPFENASKELEVQQNILDLLRARIAQENIEVKASRSNVVRMIEPAIASTIPVSPNIPMNMIIFMVLGVGAGVGMAFFMEYLDTSIKTVDDVEKSLGTPVIGIIPQRVRPLVEEGADSPHCEAYRVLRTNMQFANDGNTRGAYSVVSGGVGEGKSTTLFNMAYVAAQQGLKVLVVDSDMRRPVQHKILGLSNSFGLTNILMDASIPILDAIVPTQVDNLSFLPSGHLPRSAVGILDSLRMRQIVEELKEAFDVIYFDSPPIMGVSDASILASEVDGVVLVVQYRKYPKMVSQRAKRLIDNAGGKILGVVLNNINILRDDYYYYYHSYYENYYDGSGNRPPEPEEQKKTLPKSEQG